MSRLSVPRLTRAVLAILVGLCVALTVTMASAQGHARHHGARRSAPVVVAPVFVSPYLYRPLLPYDFYYQQELRKRTTPRELRSPSKAPAPAARVSSVRSPPGDGSRPGAGTKGPAHDRRHLRPQVERPRFRRTDERVHHRRHRRPPVRDGEGSLMGTLFRPKYTDRHGITQESAIWWVRFRQHGQTVRESTETTSERRPGRSSRSARARWPSTFP